MKVIGNSITLVDNTWPKPLSGGGILILSSGVVSIVLSHRIGNARSLKSRDKQ